MELFDYHSGSQQGNIRIPEGRFGKGWASFVREIRKFFLGIGPKPLATTVNNVAIGMASVKGGHNYGHKSRNLPGASRQSRDVVENVMKPAGISQNSKGSVFERVIFNQHINPRVLLDEDEPHPTRKFEFKWKPSTKTLRITKVEGGKWASEWVHSHQPKESTFDRVIGPAKNTSSGPISNMNFVEPTKPITHIRSTVEAVTGVGQPSFFTCLDSVYENDESSQEADEVLANPLATTDVGCELFDRRNFGSQGSASPARQLVGSADTDNPSTPALVSQSLPVVLFSENPATSVGPLTGEPIQSIVSDQDGCFESETERSKWLDWQYRRFSKQVGVSIVGFEDQCYSLLCRIDVERKKKIMESGPRQSSVSRKKCLRELKSLPSSVNYEGKQLCF